MRKEELKKIFDNMLSMAKAQVDNIDKALNEENQTLYALGVADSLHYLSSQFLSVLSDEQLNEMKKIDRWNNKKFIDLLKSL